MAALTKGRNSVQRMGDYCEKPLAAGQRVYSGGMVMRQADGFMVNAATATGLIGAGVAAQDANNSEGADGDSNVRFRTGVFRFENSVGADAITTANIGALAYAVDDQTVALTDGTGTRSPVGLIEDSDSLGVWVRFDEALTASLAP